ncbi:cysteine desulfurase [Alkalithermobacter thermoalcaliphilus JW-YL-7 = DSM 7308]|uniref:Cysteine desulfurase n=1 Tax=Alkalithermobacter thermoalcaliphilus JW-YL-7 = DSM 7308 TaxID=1121328 RepID=A0A150FP13_CLOPD|nr:Cysteine desulfurase [[Clostridium] paradoxum JW-YL-7 = DSM 7308]SHK54132.1 cysteine desulfurase [[Clostridium] paradoxum JW-YL-7 = DSM 7308]
MEIYLDNSATTKPYDEVVEKIVYALTKEYANPSSIHRKGVIVEKQIKNIRKDIAKALGVKEKEIIFTSGGTEANNMAIRGIAYANKKRGNHIITTQIEHPSSLNTFKDLENEGFEITYLDADKKGVIDFEQLKNSIKENTILISVMHVNNEVGSIQPIDKIGRYLKNLKNKIYFHVDAIQSFGKIDFKVSKYNIDLLSVSGHKIHGPKGIGFIYINEKTKIKPILTGGGQEYDLRSGTENVPGIFGLSEAVRITTLNLENNIQKMKSLRKLLLDEITSNIDNIKINSPEDGVCHILNVSFIGTKGEILLHYLEEDNIYVSTGSACSSKKKASHVLTAMGLSKDEIEGAIRFSLSCMNTEEEIKVAVQKLKIRVEEIRKIISKR